MSCSESLKHAFRLKVSPTLLTQLAVAGVSSEEFIEFAATQFHNIIQCKPNCKIYSTQEKPIWVVRGYYPDTSVFFKLTVVKAVEDPHRSYGDFSFSYHMKAREFKASISRKQRRQPGSYFSYDELTLFSKDIMKSISDKMENALLGADNKVEPITSYQPKKPKCMSPKGMKLFSYNKPSDKKKLKRKD